ncbi:MAG TPA: carbohydrate ABC transporter permease [Candidatus Limnocylindrales bacterium]|nr:carbohydrate ABC transporter permease [Candidatus Limnocylindrales bacterium]
MKKAAKLVALLALLAVVLYPLLWMLATSFKPDNEIVGSVSLWPTEPTGKHYPEGWSAMDVSFSTFFRNSAVIAGLAVLGNCASCLLAAYAFARLRFRGRGLFFAVMIGTLLLPGHVLIVPHYILFNWFGWIDTILPLVVPKMLATEAFFIFLMVQFMRGIPRELDDAARIDGAGPYQLFWRIIVPLARPALVTSAIFSFIWTWNDFLTQLLYLNDLEKITVPVALRNFLDSTGQTSLGPMFAMSVLSLLPVFAFFVAFQRMLVQGINTTGLKG